MNKIYSLTLVACHLSLLSGCVSTVASTAVDLTSTVVVETVKLPFRVGAGVVDVMSDDDETSEPTLSAAE